MMANNAEYILAIELMAAAQAHDFLGHSGSRAPGTDLIYNLARDRVSHYEDDRPLGLDIEALRSLLRQKSPPASA